MKNLHRTLIETADEMLTKLQEKDIKIDELEQRIEELKESLAYQNEVKTPLGTVHYTVTGSLKLSQFMESIEDQIRAL